MGEGETGRDALAVDRTYTHCSTERSENGCTELARVLAVEGTVVVVVVAATKTTAAASSTPPAADRSMINYFQLGCAVVDIHKSWALIP